VAEAAEAAGAGEVVDGGGSRGCSPLRWVGLISHSARNRHPPSPPVFRKRVGEVKPVSQSVQFHTRVMEITLFVFNREGKYLMSQMFFS